MSSYVSVRELRNGVRKVLRRVENGERVTVIVDRRPVAELVPLRSRRAVPARDAVTLVRRYPADRALLQELRGLMPGATYDL